MSPRAQHRPAPAVIASGCTAPAAAGRHTPGPRRAAGRLLGTGLVGLALIATACGDDDSATVTTVAETPATSAATGPTVTVRAVDFAFQDLPTAVTAGTRFTLDNTAATEMHEMVAIPIAADETRPIGELVRDDLEALLTSAPPAFVVLAPPGEADPITAVGDVARQNLDALGHVTVNVDGADKAKMHGAIHVRGEQMPQLYVGSTIAIEA